MSAWGTRPASSSRLLPSLDLILQGSEWLARGRAADALHCAEEALRRDPRDADALFLLGAAHYRDGNLADAEARLKQAIQANGKVAVFHSTLGNVYQDRGALPEAVAAYRRAIRLKPDFVEAHNDLGTAFFAQGDPARAAQSYQRATELRPDHAVAYANLEVGISDCMIGPQLGGALIALCGARGVALREKRGAEVVVRFNEVGLEPNGAAIGRDRLGQRAAVLVDVAQSAVEDRHLAVRLNGLLQTSFGVGQIAVAVVRGAEQEQRVRIARIAAQRFFGAMQRIGGAPACEPFAALQDQIKRWQQARARRRPRSPGGPRRLRCPWCKPGLPIAGRGGCSLRR